MAATIMATNPDSIAYVKEGKDAHWEYEMGVILQGIEQVWYRTADDRYFQYIQKNMDRYVNPTAASAPIKWMSSILIL